MKALVGAFNQEKALVGPLHDCTISPINRFAALLAAAAGGGRCPPQLAAGYRVADLDTANTITAKTYRIRFAHWQPPPHPEYLR